MACSSPFGREGLALRPGKAHGFPALEPPSMAIGIEWPLETVRDIATAPIASRRHRSGSLEAALPGATDEKQLAILIGAERRLAGCSAHPCNREMKTGFTHDLLRMTKYAIQVMQPITAIHQSNTRQATAGKL